jgi:selenocysteine lyase/cysteine desulfurase
MATCLGAAPRLTSLSHDGGCGCKIAPGVLADLLRRSAPPKPFTRLLVGTETADDAAVYQLNDELAVIATTVSSCPLSMIRSTSDESRLRTRASASLLGCTPEEIVFTSGGSEANNLALKGAFFATPSERRHIITTQIEHPAVLSPCRFLERHGARVTYLAVDGTGSVDPDDLRRAHEILITYSEPDITMRM